MAKYVLGDKEVTEEEFYKTVFKVEEESFFLDEVLDSFFPPKNKKEILKELYLKKSNALKELEAYRYKIDNLEGAYNFKLPVTGVIHHTGGTVFEKIQDSTTPNKNIDPFYVVDIKNIKSVEIPPIGFNIQDPLEAYKAITGHSTRHKSQAVKAEDNKTQRVPIKGWKPVPKIGKKESKTVEKAPVFTYCEQMKNAIEALSLRSLAGHKKYEKGDDWENFSRVENGDFEYSNAQFRHALGIGEDSDEDHLVAAAWNAVSRLEIHLRNKK